METIGERLIEARSKKGLTQADVAEMIGITPSAYGRYESKGYVPRKRWPAIEKALGVYQREFTADPQRQDDYAALKKVRCLLDHTGKYFKPDTRTETHLKFSKTWLRYMCDRKNAVTMTISCENMGDTIRPGDTVIIDAAAREIECGRVYLIVSAATLLLRRLLVLPSGVIQVVSDHADKDLYPTLNMNIEDITIVGKVVWRSGQI